MTPSSLPQLADQLAHSGEHGTAAVWRHFHTLCTTPRQSKKEQALIATLRAWADTKGIANSVDTAGNLLLRKPASPGYERAPGVILQNHLDMVCQVNQGVAHDFSRDPVPLTLRDGWVIAERSTLGADNGIGVALALAVLEQNDLLHGPLEVLLTVDEEEGMGGALGLPDDLLSGTLLLNLDTEEWGEFYIGCAGGLEVDAHRPLRREPIAAGRTALTLTVDGLTGGHSGADIHLGRGHANKLLVRALRLLESEVDLRLVSLDGGTARNAIPREATATITLPAHEVEAASTLVDTLAATLRTELAGVDSGVALHLSPTTLDHAATHITTHVAATEQSAMLALLHAAPWAVRRMSPSVAGVVETSNNLGTMRIDAEGFRCNFMVRSLVDSAAQALGDELASLAALAGCSVEISGHYPGWRPNPESALLQRCRSVYAQKFGQESKVQVIHAGLECGIIGGKYPALDMVSFGPTIRGAHAPGERVEIASVNQCWHLLVAILAELTSAKS